MQFSACRQPTHRVCGVAVQGAGLTSLYACALLPLECALLPLECHVIPRRVWPQRHCLSHLAKGEHSECCCRHSSEVSSCVPICALFGKKATSCKEGRELCQWVLWCEAHHSSASHGRHSAPWSAPVVCCAISVPVCGIAGPCANAKLCELKGSKQHCIFKPKQHPEQGVLGWHGPRIEFAFIRYTDLLPHAAVCHYTVDHCA